MENALRRFVLTLAGAALSRLELVINYKTAGALGITDSREMLLYAGKGIE